MHLITLAIPTYDLIWAENLCQRSRVSGVRRWREAGVCCVLIPVPALTRQAGRDKTAEAARDEAI